MACLWVEKTLDKMVAIGNEYFGRWHRQESPAQPFHVLLQVCDHVRTLYTHEDLSKPHSTAFFRTWQLYMRPAA